MANFEKNYNLGGGVLQVNITGVDATLCEVGDVKKVEGKRTKCVTLYYTAPGFKKSYPKTFYEEDSRKFFLAASHALSLERDIKNEKTNGLDTEYLEEVRPIVDSLQHAKFYVHELTFGNGVKFCPYEEVLTKKEAAAKKDLKASELKSKPNSVFDPESPTGIRTVNQIAATTSYSLVRPEPIDEGNIINEIKVFGAYLNEAKIEELNKTLAE